MKNVTHEARHACGVSSNFQVWKLARSMNNRYKYAFKCRKSPLVAVKNAVKNYDFKIFPARLGWLKHFPASAQLKFGSASAERFFAELLRLRLWRPGLFIVLLLLFVNFSV